MKSFLKFIAVIVAALVVVIAAIVMTGSIGPIVLMAFGPSEDFATEEKAPAPDYAETRNWAALPFTDDRADLVPAGVAARSTPAEVDVFFIHPTGFINGSSWNSHMDPDSATEENTEWMMANQASSYNGCCDVFAPRYREASIFAYFQGDEEKTNEVLSFAYQDVERAFDYFLTHYSKGRPFIIASHSQGTHHGMTLLKQKISGTPLRDRMVAAYIIGGGITHEDLAETPDLAPCDAPDDLHCVIHWATYAEGAKQDNPFLEGKKVLCTNPLSWKDDGPRAPKSTHKGAVRGSGQFNIEFWKDDVARDVVFEPLSEPLPEYTWAECKEGLLTVEDQSGKEFSELGTAMGKNYHGLDYPLFHMDIRENTVLRTERYLAMLAQAVENDGGTD